MFENPGEEALKTYEKGQVVKAKVLDIDVEKERVSLGIKQLDGDPIEKAGPSGGALRKNQVVTGTVTEVNDGGIEVEVRRVVDIIVLTSQGKCSSLRSRIWGRNPSHLGF